MIELEITLPEKVSMNKVKGMNHFAWYRLAETFHSEFADVKGVKVVEYPVRIHYYFTFKNKPLDSLNVALMAKLLEDGMVQAKILEDDSPEYVYESRLRSQKGGEKDKVLVRICSLQEKEE